MTTLTARRFDTGEAIRIQFPGKQVTSIFPASVSAAELESLPFVAPGLFDIQLNGFNGIWFSSEQLTVAQVEQVIHDYLKQGITRCFPTLITNSAEAIEHGLAVIRQARQKSDAVREVVAGCHVEGPFISAADGPRGAHPLAHVRPASVAEFRRWQDAAGGLVKLVTLAPENPGAMEFIRQVSAMGVVIAVGHTGATSNEILQAIDCGARLGTHLGNGCSGVVPRHDNVFWPQLADDRLTCSVIADGWHVPAAMLNCILRCKSLSRTILTCDVSGFGGCRPGRYSTGDIAVDVLESGKIVVAGQTQFLAGSGATTGECVAHLMNICGVNLAEAWPLASSQPAAMMKHPIAGLQEGSIAHFTVFRMKPSTTSDGRNSVSYQPEYSVAGGVVYQ